MSRYPFKRWLPAFVLAPVQLNHADGVGTFSFDFTVDDALWALLQTAPREAAIAPHQLRLVIFNDECQDVYSVSPPRDGLALRVNERLVVLPEYSNVDPCERFYGTDITAIVHAGKNTLSVTIDKCMCIYRFGVRQVDQLGDAELTQIVVQRGQLVDADAAYAAARAKLVASFVSHTDVVLQETAIRASLHDPVTLVRLRIPARGTVCTHAQCFDLPSYISFQRSDVRFLCPVCQQRVLFEDLVIDPFFARVLEEIGPRVDDVCIFPDGTVKPLETAASPRRSTRRALPSTVVSSHAAKRSRTTAGGDSTAAGGAADEHDNDDDDADDAFFARLKQQIEKPTDVIDLT
jgi:hypothetical protein